MPTATATPYRMFTLQVARTRRLTPSLLRVTFTGPELSAFASDGRDQSLTLFLPRPGQTEPVMPPVEYGDGWRQAWIDTPEDIRAVMRSYTLRALRQDAHGTTTEVDIDFVLHGTEPGAATPAGPASRWAADAGPGDRAVLLGPSVADNGAIRFRPPADADLVLLWADETALPAASAILETLPAGTRARVWLEVPHAGDRHAPPRRGRRRDHLARTRRGRPQRGGGHPRRPTPRGRRPVRLDRGRGRLREGAAAPPRTGAGVRPHAGHVRRLLAARAQRGATARTGRLALV